MDFKQNPYESWKFTKAATFKSFLLLGHKINFSVDSAFSVFNIFMRHTLTNDFWGYTKISIARSL